MSLTREEVRRVAALARLELATDEEALYAQQLGRVVDYIDQLGRFPVAEPAEAANDPGLSRDEPAPGLPLALVIANAPQRIGPYIAVPRVLDTDD